MRMFVAILAIIAIAFAGTAMAADVPQSTLAQMGMQNMQKVSDAQGQQIRGLGGDEVLKNVLNLYRIKASNPYQKNDMFLSGVIIPPYKEIKMVNNANAEKVVPKTGRDPALDLDQVNVVSASSSKQTGIDQLNKLSGIPGYTDFAPLAVGSDLKADQKNTVSIAGQYGNDLVQRNLIQVGGVKDAGGDFVPLVNRRIIGGLIVDTPHVVQQRNIFTSAGGGTAATQINKAVILP